MEYPKAVRHWLGGRQHRHGDTAFWKYNPATGERIGEVFAGNTQTVESAVSGALRARNGWRKKSPAERARVISNAVDILKSEEARTAYADVLIAETGRSRRAVEGELSAARGYGEYYSDYSLLSGQGIVGHEKNRFAHWRWMPSLGVVALFTPFNGPFSTLAKNVFPALLLGNVIVAKGHEDVPHTSVAFGMLLARAGLPPGVFSVVQGFGRDVGQALASHQDVTLISATVSVPTSIALHHAAVRQYGLAKIAIESGGKNAMVICDDADLEYAADLAVQSAFGNAGQMCAAASRIIILDPVYNRCKNLIVEKTEKLGVGSDDSDFVPPIINERRLNETLEIVAAGEGRGVCVVTGGCRLWDDRRSRGYYMAPTILENVSPSDRISQSELFAPVTCLYRATDMNDALALANFSPFGLASSCHTSNLHVAETFIQEIDAGVVRINGPTFGAEPQHIPFGGIKGSGNGARMQGTDALAVYGEKKFVSVDFTSSCAR